MINTEGTEMQVIHDLSTEDMFAHFVKCHCDNYGPTDFGECWGLNTPSGKLKSEGGTFRDDGECWVLAGNTCAYFERCVLTRESDLSVVGMLSTRVAECVYRSTCVGKPPRKVDPRLESFIKGTTNPLDKTPGCSRFNFCECKILDCERCGYFEKAVLPTADVSGSKGEILCLYKDQTNYVPEKRDKVGHCKCGKEREKGKQYCPECRAKHRRNNDRDSKRRKRGQK